jgi:hypothetical protein
MTHLVKIQLQHSDMFVRSLDIEKNLITFQIRDKITGHLLEPEITQPFVVNDPEQKIEFGARFIHIGLAQIVATHLN